MSKTLDIYNSNGYMVINSQDGSYIVWKYHKGNDVSQDGTLYARKFKLDSSDSMTDSVIKLITVGSTDFEALADDNAIGDFIMQEHSK